MSEGLSFIYCARLIRRDDIKLKRTDQKGFTLAELLAVIAIISIMIAIALPRFDLIGKRSSLDSATGSVVAMLNLARQHAVINRQPTYLLVKGDQSEDPENAYRQFAVYTIHVQDARLGVPVNPDDGEYVVSWTDLPGGIVFDNTDDRSENILLIGGLGFAGGFDDHSRLQVNGTNYYVCGFSVSGERESDNAYLYLAEGVYPGTAVYDFVPTSVTEGKYKSLLIHVAGSGEINVISEMTGVLQ